MLGKSGRSILALEIIPPWSSQRKIGLQGNRWWKSSCVLLNVRPEPNAGEVVLDSADGLNWETLCKCDLIYAVDRDLLHTRRGQVTAERRREIVRVIVGCHGWNSI